MAEWNGYRISILYAMVISITSIAVNIILCVWYVLKKYWQSNQQETLPQQLESVVC